MDKEFSLRNHLCQLEERLLKPEIRTSQRELTNLLTDEFFEIGSSGRVLYKGEEIGSNGIGVVNMSLSNFDIHPLSDEIVLTTYRVCNEETKQHSLRSSIWKYIDGRWQMFFHQGTKTSDME